MRVIGFDYETRLMSPEYVCSPPPVCLSVAGGEDDLELAVKADGTIGPTAEYLLSQAEDNEDTVLVAHNLSFDMGVMCKYSSSMFARAVSLYRQHRLKDTMIREKLLDLAQHGKVGGKRRPDGTYRHCSYSLAELVKQYLGLDISQDKKEEDAWRTNYQALEDKTLEEWPEDAIEYAVMDSVYAVRVYEEQEKRRVRVRDMLGSDPLEGVEDFRALCDIVLTQVTLPGILTDPKAHASLSEEMRALANPENYPLMVQGGYLKPAVPPMPYKNGAKNPDGTPKMKKAVKTKIAQTKLRQFVWDLMKHKDLPVVLTDKGQELVASGIEASPKHTSIGKDFLTASAHLSPVLLEYESHSKLQKILTTELPRMEWPKGSGVVSPVVHPNYSVLMSTGRTSSSASKHFPSFNGQNVDPRARRCFVPRDGFFFYSVDVSAMELCTLAQKCINLFGFSDLGDAIVKGHDVHSYLGTQLAYHLCDLFRAIFGSHKPTPEEAYLVFYALKSEKDTEGEDAPLCPKTRPHSLFKHYRKFAKPTGLGFPGGLGAATFVGFARTTYGVSVTVPEAKRLKEIWLDTYREMRKYFKWVTKQVDPYHKTENGSHTYRYRTPLGMWRSAATYCQIANGAALQAPSAEGALAGLCEVVTRTYLGQPDILSFDNLGVTHRPLNFIHDEILGEARYDVAPEVVAEVSRCLESGLQLVCPDVTIRTEGALMHRWDKGAEPVFNEEGRLIPWVGSEQSF